MKGNNTAGLLEFEVEYWYNHKLRGRVYVNNKLEYEGEYLYDKKWNRKRYDVI